MNPSATGTNENIQTLHLKYFSVFVFCVLVPLRAVTIALKEKFIVTLLKIHIKC